MLARSLVTDRGVANMDTMDMLEKSGELRAPLAGVCMTSIEIHYDRGEGGEGRVG